MKMLAVLWVMLNKWQPSLFTAANEKICQVVAQRPVLSTQCLPGLAGSKILPILLELLYASLTRNFLLRITTPLKLMFKIPSLKIFILCACVPRQKCGGQKITLGSQVSPCTMWALWVEGQAW